MFEQGPDSRLDLLLLGDYDCNPILCLESTFDIDTKELML